jgi:hypothetical protein
MKVAICYGGNLRTFEYCVKNHGEIIGNADVYISTWDEIINSNNINDPLHRKIELSYPDLVSEDYIERVMPKTFYIKSIKIEKYDSLNLKKLKKYNHLNYQYYKIKDSFNLITENKYDFIIRLRPDITIGSINYSEDQILFDENIWYNHKKTPSQKSINEMIWVSNYDLMSKSVRIYDNLEIINSSLSDLEFYGESICHKNLEIEGLLDNIGLFNFQYNVVR